MAVFGDIDFFPINLNAVHSVLSIQGLAKKQN